MSKQNLAHDSLGRNDDVKLGSNRNFGFVFAAVFVIVAVIQIWTGRHAYWPWLAGAGGFLFVAMVVPRLLHPLNFIWFKFGMLLHHIITPIVLGLMYFGVFTPMALLMRAFKKRPLSLQFDRLAASYWIVRRPPGPPPESFKNQF